MPKYEFSCFYCGHDFEVYLYTQEDADSVRCPQCKDRKLKPRDTSRSDVFGYDFKEGDENWRKS